ncbi:Crp/Fnr family transcriptional regulator [Candidatus Thiothrix anitrata]|jgi:CRP/FNR family transcriptional regulator|uniref:Crp/Fnr family transcriptional regulator n=1 Tax=Candidatus Thiothrix anitrata TaxID=2823902 RepID=A0ABX7WZT0_9GAMM|nr:Crp/Fnr family transcriptional regulator [Candidatus Thiothrix anitrata]QTR49174.1 Crp/Fnr family transcriptional regulator [Candidatus Thiothrix anitrata]
MNAQKSHMGEFHCLIRQLGILTELDAVTEENLHNIEAEHLNFSAGSSVYETGLPAAAVYVLVSGYVKLVKTTLLGKSQIIRIVKAGEVFGFDGLVAEHYNHSAATMGDAQVCRIPVAALEDLGEHRAEVERQIMVRCIKELQRADGRLLELGAKRSDERLASFLLDWCQLMPADAWIPLVLSRLEIAQFLGLTIETVSRLFASWKREGILKEKKQAIRVMDWQRLKLLAESH